MSESWTASARPWGLPRTGRKADRLIGLSTRLELTSGQVARGIDAAACSVGVRSIPYLLCWGHGLWTLPFRKRSTPHATTSGVGSSRKPSFFAATFCGSGPTLPRATSIWGWPWRRRTAPGGGRLLPCLPAAVLRSEEILQPRAQGARAVRDRCRGQGWRGGRTVPRRRFPPDLRGGRGWGLSSNGTENPIGQSRLPHVAR